MGTTKHHIRPLTFNDADEIARIHLRGWQTAYRGIMPDAFLDGLDLAVRAQHWKQRLAAPDEGAFGLVVQDADEAIHGFAYGGAPRDATLGYDAELALIYLHEASKGRGLGTLLFQAFCDECANRGMRNLYLYVLEGNPATEFYERLDGVRNGEESREYGGVALRSWRYVWPRLPVET